MGPDAFPQSLQPTRFSRKPAILPNLEHAPYAAPIAASSFVPVCSRARVSTDTTTRRRRRHSVAGITDPEWCRNWTSRTPATSPTVLPENRGCRDPQIRHRHLRAFSAERMPDDLLDDVPCHAHRGVDRSRSSVANRGLLLPLRANAAWFETRNVFHRWISQRIPETSSFTRQKPPPLPWVGPQSAAFDMGSRARGAR